MICRRKLLASLGAISGTVAVAGCSGEEPTDEADSETDPDSDPESEEAEPETELLADVRVDNITLTHGFSSGVGAEIQLTNQDEREPKNVNIRIEAFDGDRSIGTDGTWTDIGSELSAEVNLNIEELAVSADDDLEDITEFVISGRLEGNELGTIESLTGEELRNRVD